MAASKASRDRLRQKRFKNRRPTSREQLLPKKVAKEQWRFDQQYAIMKQQIEKAYPDPTERLRYINSLLRGLDEMSQEIKATGAETGRSSATEPNPSNMPKEATSGFAIVEDTVSFDEEEVTASGRTPSEPELQNVPTPTHDGNCSCGHHEETES